MAALTLTRILFRKTRDSCNLMQRRNRFKKKWATTLPRFPATRLALQNFDVNYSMQFGELWPSVRVGLLCEPKYGALINAYSEMTRVQADLQLQGARDFVREQTCADAQADYQGAETSPVEPSKQTADDGVTRELRPKIRCFVFPKADVSRFKPARPDSSGLLGYYLLDAASVLPVLALDVQEGHSVLDLCAAPGGKALALLQTQGIRQLTVHDSSESRILRLRRVLQQYVPREEWSNRRVHITCCDGRMWTEMGRSTFDRVLVDVPCTADRHSVMVEDNNIFKKCRTKERQKLPLLQTELLVAGIEAVRPGGVVVYSTCTLSQLQNECVVEQALRVAGEERGVAVQVEDLAPLARSFAHTFHFAPARRLGQLVVPHLTANFGPTYLCKLRRVG